MHANFGWKLRKINKDKASVSASRFAYFLSLFQVTNANAREAELHIGIPVGQNGGKTERRSGATLPVSFSRSSQAGI